MGLSAVLSLGLVPAAALADEVVDEFVTESIYSEEAGLASAAVEGDFFYEVRNNGEAAIVGYRGSARDVVIPSIIGGLPVKALGYDLFKNNQTIDSLTIPESVTSIGSELCAYSSVKTVNFPAFSYEWSLSQRSLFVGCNLLTAINIPDSSNAFCTVNGNLYNKDQTELIFYAGGKPDTFFTVPATVTTIGANAFSGAANLLSLTLPDSVQTINSDAFAESSIQTINIGSGLQSIAGNPFAAATTQVNIDLANPYFICEDGVVYSKDKSMLVAYLGERFDDCIEVDPSVTSVGEKAFIYCSGDGRIIFPTTIAYASPSAFYLRKHSDDYINKLIIFRGGVSAPTMNWVLTHGIGYVGDDSVVRTMDDATALCYLNWDLSHAEAYAKDINYTGLPVTTTIEFPNSFFNIPFNLIEGIDYTVTYENNVNPGQATAIITGIGDFYGTTTATFNIIGDIPSGGNNGGSNSGGSSTNPGNSGTTNPPAKPNQSATWVQDSNGWWYKNADGSYPTNKWVQIGSAWYYFNKSGYMQTGWQQVGGKWYYLGTNGVMTTGWQKVGGAWYYLNDSGVMQTGWQQVDGSWYYFNGSGVMQIGWLQTGGKWYYLKSSGAMATGWVSVGGTWYYMNASGIMQTGWQQIGDSWYYLKNSGAMATGWYQVGSKWYYSNSSGVMQTNRWVGNYWVGESGAMATNAWIGNYHVNASGVWDKTA